MFLFTSLESEACIMQAVQVSRDDPLDLHGMSLFRSEFAYLESPISQRMTLKSCLGRPRAGTDDLFCAQPSASAWHPGQLHVGGVPMSQLLTLQVQILSIIRSPERIRLLEADTQKPNSQKADGQTYLRMCLGGLNESGYNSVCPVE